MISWLDDSVRSKKIFENDLCLLAHKFHSKKLCKCDKLTGQLARFAGASANLLMRTMNLARYRTGFFYDSGNMWTCLLFFFVTNLLFCSSAFGIHKTWKYFCKFSRLWSTGRCWSSFLSDPLSSERILQKLQNEFHSVPSRGCFLISSQLRCKFKLWLIRNRYKIAHQQLQCEPFVVSQIYSLYSNNRNIFHDLTRKDKVQQGRLVGDLRPMDINDKHVKDLLRDHLGRLITGDESKFTYAYFIWS